MNTKHVVFALLAMSATSFAVSADETMHTKVRTACATEIKTAGCEEKKLGEGLLKCVHEYKREHKDFTISAECKEAAKAGREEIKEHRSERKENK